MPPTVFIHTNHKQMVGALVSQYSMRRNSRHADRFEVKLIEHKDQPWLAAKEGQPYLRDGIQRIWRNDDLQSFTPLRFMPPQLMGYEGRAVVVDPDIFAVGDVWELLNRDMGEASVMCRSRSGAKQRSGCMATSVMLLDCAKLTHWDAPKAFEELFAQTLDYMDWICLKLEPRDSIDLFEREWNDFDRLTPATKLLHNTRRKTQPWKTGLPVDFLPPEKPSGLQILGWLHRTRRRFFGDYGLLGHYKSHPDRKQEAFFFGLLRECLEQGIVSEDLLRAEMQRNHVRHDAFEVIDRTPPLAA